MTDIKRAQEKSSASTGVEMFSRDPAHGNLASLEKLDSCPFSVSSGELAAPSNLRERLANGDSRSAIVLSAARGLCYFWLSEGA